MPRAEAGKGGSPPGNDGGFVQVLVVVGLALVGGLLTAALLQSGHSSKLAQADDLRVRGGAAARSAIDRVLSAIEDPSDGLELQLLGHSTTISVEGAEALVELRGEGGKINPAYGAPELIASYLVKAGMPPDQAALLSRQVGKYRQTDDSMRAMAFLASRVFPSIDLSRLNRDFGVWNTGTGIDPRSASDAVLESVPDLSPPQVAAIKAAVSAGLPLPANSSYFSAPIGIFCVTAKVQWSADQVVDASSAFEITSGGSVLVRSTPCGI